MSRVPGSRLGLYEIRGTLGAGGMGTVYRHYFGTQLVAAAAAGQLQRATDARAAFDVLRRNHPEYLQPESLQRVIPAKLSRSLAASCTIAMAGSGVRACRCSRTSAAIHATLRTSGASVTPTRSGQA